MIDRTEIEPGLWQYNDPDEASFILFAQPTRSFLKLLNQLSVGALSQQFPLRLIEQVIPYALSLS